MQLGQKGAFATDYSKWFWPRIGLGVLLIAIGSVICRHVFDIWGADLAQLYMSAKLFLEGKNVYDFPVQRDGYARHIGQITTWGHFYPPGSAVALVPATIVPYATAREIYFYLGIVVMLYGLWRFMQAYIPRWDASVRVLVLGLLMCTASVRWGFKVGQPIAIVVGLFGLFLAELKAERSWSAFLCAAVVGSVKVTFGIPFVLLGLATRRLRLTAALLGFWAALNVIGIFGMGGPKILLDYRANMAVFERPDELNYPDPRGFNSLARTDWPYILNAVSPDFSRNKLIGHVLTLLALGWLTREVWRARERALGETQLLALTAPVMALSMLAVYHHHYDISVMFVPWLALVGRPELLRIRSAWAYILPVGLYAGFYPYEKFARLVAYFLGDIHVLFTKPLACAVCIVALVGSCVVLRRVLAPGYRDEEVRAEVPGGIAAPAPGSSG